MPGQNQRTLFLFKNSMTSFKFWNFITISKFEIFDQLCSCPTTWSLRQTHSSPSTHFSCLLFPFAFPDHCFDSLFLYHLTQSLPSASNLAVILITNLLFLPNSSVYFLSLELGPAILGHNKCCYTP